jgi:transcriptional regulator with XRE-family HTH domain
MTFKELRERGRWSRRLLAKELGYKNPATIAKWEDGTSYPTLAQVFKLAELLEENIAVVALALKAQHDKAIEPISPDREAGRVEELSNDDI